MRPIVRPIARRVTESLCIECNIIGCISQCMMYLQSITVLTNAARDTVTAIESTQALPVAETNMSTTHACKIRIYQLISCLHLCA